MNRYGIIGLGWLGLELCKALKVENLPTWGTTTSTEKLKTLSNEGLDVSYFELKENELKGSIVEQLQKTTHLFINIPPGLRKSSTTNYVQKLSRFLDLLAHASVQHLVFVSSTGVFLDAKDIPVYTEESRPNATSERAKQLIDAENLILNLHLPTVQLLRLGGLVGGERHPANYLSGRNDVGNPQAPVNMIRREDAVALSKSLLQSKKSGVFHGVYPNYPTRRFFYTQACKNMNLPIPNFNDLDSNVGKKISSLKTSNELNFNFDFQP